MKLSKFLPIPILIGIFAFIWMVAAARLNVLAWVGFITWGAYFLTSVNTRGALREAISFTVGIIFGALIVVVATNYLSPLGSFAFPVAVGIAGFVIVLLEMVPWFDMAPGYFLGAAAFFAAGAKPDVATFSAVWIPGMLGLGLGIITAYLRGGIFKMEGEKDPLTAKST